MLFTRPIDVCIATSVDAYLKSASSQNCCSIIKRVLDSSQAIPDGILDLSQGMVCRALDEHSARGWVPHILHKGVLVLTQDMFIHLSGIPEAASVQVSVSDVQISKL